jgi:hypothetical protein
LRFFNMQREEVVTKEPKGIPWKARVRRTLSKQITGPLRLASDRALLAVRQDIPYLKMAIVALVVHTVVALAASRLPELGDEPSFRGWAMNSLELGIGLAYRPDGYWYDWLPTYLYVSKSVGWFYTVSGLYERFGVASSALTFCLKMPMILFNLLTGWLVFRLVRSTYGDKGYPRAAAGAWLFNPALVLATDVFGYQDGLHTFLMFGAAVLAVSGRATQAGAAAAFGCLTKPQAVPFLIPGILFMALTRGWCGLGRAFAGGLVASAAVLLPFVLQGRLGRVTTMATEVPHIHQWLTGCAHNIWWLLRPVPPFYSDRLPLILGLNGMTIGLGAFLALSGAAIWHLHRQPSPHRFLHASAFTAFSFFMVVTQIHENHLYAMFPYLAVFVGVSRFHRLMFLSLTVTFALDLALTLWLLNTDVPIRIGPVRLSLVNAAVNVVLLAAWVGSLIARENPIDSVRGQGSVSRPPIS